MARWAGTIGFVTQSETLNNGVPTGIWTETVTEKSYKGDLLRARRSSMNDNQINDGITISNQISFIADPYATSNFHFMRYATFMGQKWKISSIDFEAPRVIISLGDKYNG